MLDFTRFWRYYRYPHYYWVLAIRDLLRRAGIGHEGTIIDAPCGDGAVAFGLIQHGIGRRFELCDLSERAIRAARRLENWNRSPAVNVTVAHKDIFQLDAGASDHDIWLLINSLFLLPDIDRLVSQLRPRARHIVGLFPYTDHRNYRCYLRLDPHTNIHAMDRDGTVEFFERNGYDLCDSRDVTFIAYHCLPTKIARRISRLALMPLERFVPHRNGSYWIGLFARR